MSSTETTPAEIDRLLASVAHELIADLSAAIGDEASQPNGPYASVWDGMRRAARLPLSLRIDNPIALVKQLAAAGMPDSPPSLAVLARHAMISYLYDRQANALDASARWWQHIIDLATEIAERNALVDRDGI